MATLLSVFFAEPINTSHQQRVASHTNAKLRGYLKKSDIFLANTSIYQIYLVTMKTTLDEWEILQTVVQLGGFAPAAEQLNRSQSTISYAISRLQEQIGIKLFEQQGRKAHLTEAGRVLLADAEPHLAGFHQLEQRARSYASSSGQSEIRLSVDSIFPNERLFAALAEFARRFPYVHQKLRHATFISADSEFSAHNAHLCVGALMSREYFVKPILDIRMKAVAHRDHPLHSLKRQVSRIDMMQHMLVVIGGASPGSIKRQPRSPAQRFLSVSTIEAAIDAVRSGLCFGWLPEYRIQSYLANAEFLPLRMPVGGTREVRLNLVCRDSNLGDREVNVLAELLGMNGHIQTI
jgi:DNA-binding transcriptional LysR family regulator